MIKEYFEVQTFLCVAKRQVLNVQENWLIVGLLIGWSILTVMQIFVVCVCVCTYV